MMIMMTIVSASTMMTVVPRPNQIEPTLISFPFIAEQTSERPTTPRHATPINENSFPRLTSWLPTRYPRLSRDSSILVVHS
jgi:hypothetical protein